MTGIDLHCHELVSFTNIMTSFLRDSIVAGVIVVLYYKLTKNRLNMQVSAGEAEAELQGGTKFSQRFNRGVGAAPTLKMSNSYSCNL